MARFTALYDACVLYPAPLRDLLMQLALSDLYRAKWTDRIHAEWMRNLLANRPDLQRFQLERVRDLMNAHVRDSLVSGYEFLEASLDLPDPDDRHVVAAAIKAHTDVIVTYNLNDFPESILRPLGLEAQHPYEFMSHLIDLAPAAVIGAAKACRQRLRNPPMEGSDYLDCLERQQLPVTVGFLKRNLFLI
jgi:predicted nucleic acid-binding protein